MKFILKKKSLTAAVGLALLGMGTANTAHASAYAFASNLITDFSITVVGDINMPVGTRGTTSASTVNGTDPALSNGPVPLPNASNVGEASMGFSAGEDNFADNAGLVLSGDTITFGRGDAVTDAGSSIDGGVPRVYAVAEANVVGSGTSTGAGGNTASINGITTTSGATFQISYTVDSNLYAWTGGASGDSASASIASAYTLTDTTGTYATQFFAPIVCHQNSSITAPPNVGGPGKPGSNQGDAACVVSQGASVFTLFSDGIYNLSLSNTVKAEAVEVVPEPASMFLVGSALSALAFTTRRRKTT